MTPRRRIAITGIGMVTPVGHDAPTTWANLCAGRGGVAAIRSFDASTFPTRIGAEVKDFEAAARIRDRKLLKHASRSQRFALAAAAEAFADAGIRPEPRNAHRWGCIAGAGMMSVTVDDLQTVHAFSGSDGEFHAEGLLNPEFPVDPIAFFRSLLTAISTAICRTQTNSGLALLTRHYGILGYATAVHTACASGGQALGTALKVMRRGLADCVLAGGYDSMLNPIGLTAFCLLGALSTEAACQRGARIYAELAGDGNSLSSYRITDSPPSGEGPIQAMQQALADATLTPSDLDYVNAHGTSTLMNDRSECAALRAVLHDRVGQVAVSSTKSCMGHLIAAAGAVEAGICALAIRDGVAPVNANYTEPDPDCNVNLVLGASRPGRIRAALSNSLGFGGSNSCLAFRHPEEVERLLRPDCRNRAQP